MKTLRNGGALYRGVDPEGQRDVVAYPGEIVTVSDAKALQLQTDWPGRWEDLGDSSLSGEPTTDVPNVLAGAAVADPKPRRKRGRPRKAVKQE